MRSLWSHNAGGAERDSRNVLHEIFPHSEMLSWLFEEKLFSVQ